VAGQDRQANAEQPIHRPGEHFPPVDGRAGFDRQQSREVRDPVVVDGLVGEHPGEVDGEPLGERQ
jgi:hypothetical protein